METNYDKLILAVITGENPAETVLDLNRNGFYATMLSSTGGFLRKKSVTLMIGLMKEDIETVLDILGKHSGAHAEVTYIDPAEAGAKPAPVKVQEGGTVAFVLNVDRSLKF